MVILGVDIGFGFTKATSGRDSLVFKSILGEATEMQFREQILGGACGGEHHQIEVDGSSYFVGELAERQSDVRFFTLDQSRLVADLAKNLALTAAAGLVSSHIPVNLVTGLPIGFYRSHKDELSRQLLGKHSIRTVDAAGKAQEKVIHVNKVRIIPQPFGSLFNLMLNELGEVGDKGDRGDRGLARQKIGIIDVGFRTSDYTVSDSMRYSERGSRTTDSGIARAFSTIAGKLREKSGVDVELYRLYDAVDRGSIKIRGKEYDLSGLTEQVFSQLAATVAGEVDRLWVDDWDIDSMVVTGGGGAVLEKYLRPLIGGQLLPLDPAKDARFSNVQGYWKFGKHSWARGVAPTAPEA